MAATTALLNELALKLPTRLDLVQLKLKTLIRAVEVKNQNSLNRLGLPEDPSMRNFEMLLEMEGDLLRMQEGILSVLKMCRTEVQVIVVPDEMNTELYKTKKDKKLPSHSSIESSIPKVEVPASRMRELLVTTEELPLVFPKEVPKKEYDEVLGYTENNIVGLYHR